MDDVLDAHSGRFQNRECVLPDLFVLCFKTIGESAVRSDARLPGNGKPACVRRDLHATFTVTPDNTAPTGGAITEGLRVISMGVLPCGESAEAER